jgi:hypothetical protein
VRDEYPDLLRLGLPDAPLAKIDFLAFHKAPDLPMSTGSD